MKTKTQIDIGWGALVSGVPTVTVTGVNAMAFAPTFGTLADLYEMQDGSVRKTETPLAVTWKFRLHKSSYRDAAAFDTAINKVLKFWQIQPKYVRGYTARWTNMHPASVWVQVVETGKMPIFDKASGLFSISGELREALAYDVSTL